MNVGKFGLVVFILGLVIAAGAGMNWMSNCEERRARRLPVRKYKGTPAQRQLSEGA